MSPSSPKNDDTHYLRVRDSVPSLVWVLAVVALFERGAFWGLTGPLQNFMQNPPSIRADEEPGALGLGQAAATRVYCGFFIFHYAASLVFAVLADSLLDRYSTLLLSTGLYCVGCAALTASSSPGLVERGWAIPGLAVAIALVALGAGGFRAVVFPLMVDQCEERKPSVERTASGDLVVTDRKLTVQFVCNLYYWFENVGSLTWFATVYVERRHGFAGAFGLALGSITVAMLMVGGGWGRYSRVRRGENILPEAARIVLCAACHGFRMSRADPDYQRTRCNRNVPWSSRLVEELTCALRASRVLFAFVTFYVCFDQMQNNLISQAGQMRTNGTPNDLLPAMNQVGCIVFAPAVSFLLYPQLHRRGIYPTAIARIRIGFVFVFLSMVWAACVQYAIYDASPCYDQPGDCAFGKVNVWMQSPVYFLIAIGEVFALPAGIELAENQSPKDARTVVQAINPAVAAVGSAVALSITPAARDPYLLAFYASLAGAMFVTTAAFALFFRGGEGGRSLPGDDGDDLYLRAIARETEAPPPGPPQLAPTVRVSYIDLFGMPVDVDDVVDDGVAKPPLPRKSSRRVARRGMLPLDRCSGTL